jgi:hypothetical protein
MKQEEAKAREAAAAEAAAAAAKAPPASSGAPAPAPAPVAPAPSPTTKAPPPSAGSGLRTAGIVTGGVGVLGLGASAVLAVVAKNKNDDANALCNGNACSTRQGVTLAHDAGSFATASTLAFAGGAALAACGVILYFSAPKGGAPSTAWAVSPVVGPTGGGLSLGAGF